MARGFESKSVTSQQEDAAPRGRRDSASGPASARRRNLELSRADVAKRLEGATAEPHREMLRRALKALDAEIASL